MRIEARCHRQQTELVSIGHHRAYTRQREVEGRHVVAQVAHEGQKEATERGIYVEVEAVTRGDVCEFAHRVQLPQAPIRRGAHQRNRPLINQRLDLVHSWPEGSVERHFVEPQAHQLGSDPEAIVRGLGHDDFRVVLLRQIAGQAQRSQVRFGAPAGDKADRLGAPEE